MVDYEVEHHRDGVNVYHFQVPHDERRQGRGTAAMRRIIEEARADGLDYVVVNMGGGDAAESFLRGLGFEIVEREPGGHVTAELELSSDFDFS